MKYTIVDYFGYNLSPKERMKAIKQAGFDGVILLWSDYFDTDYKAFPKYAEQEGLYVENTHAPYMQANALWEDTITGQEYTEHIIRCIEDCFIYNIPTLVVHPINGTTPLPKNNIGIERFKKIMDAAEKLNIQLLKIKAIRNILIWYFETFNQTSYIFVLTADMKTIIRHISIYWICMAIS